MSTINGGIEEYRPPLATCCNNTERAKQWKLWAFHPAESPDDFRYNNGRVVFKNAA